MNNNPNLEREEQSYKQAIASIYQVIVIEKNIRRAEIRSAFETEERRRLEEERTFINRDQRNDINDRYKKELETQIKLQNERVEVLERIAVELKEYELNRQKAQEELVNSSAVEQKPEGIVKRENTKLLDEGVRQTLMDVSAERKANLEALIANNPAWKRFVAPESYVKDEIVAGRNVTALGLAAEITFKAQDGEDITPCLAAHLDGPARGIQAALREHNDPRDVEKTVRTIVDICMSEDDSDAPDFSEKVFAKKLLDTKGKDERYELVNGELKGEALPLQIALSDIPDSKRDKACIETLKGYGEDTTELERERGLSAESKKPEQTVFKLSPREQELAHIAKLSLQFETPSLAPTIEHGIENSKELQSSRSIEI